MKKLFWIPIVLISIFSIYFFIYKDITCPYYEETKTVGKIIPLEESNSTEKSIDKDKQLFRENVEKNYSNSGWLDNDCDKRRRSLENLSKLLKDNKISGYSWNHAEITISFLDGLQFTYLLSSGK